MLRQLYLSNYIIGSGALLCIETVSVPFIYTYVCMCMKPFLLSRLSACIIYDCFVFQGVVYQLDVALESIDTQRSGLVFIYDMSDSKYSNFDYDLSQKILTLLKVRHFFVNSKTES